MHWLDRAAAAALARTPPGRRVFRDGWGDRDLVDLFLEHAADAPPLVSLDVAERPARRIGNLLVRDLTFESPAEHLPEESRMARARLVSPVLEPERLCLLMAAWNDHGYQTRGRLAGMLADDGIASLMLENPLYGDRRRDRSDGLPVATVSDFGIMGRAAVLEGRALAAHYHDLGYRVGVSGYSMGGNIAAIIAATVPFPVATAPLAASHSPGPVFLHGILRLAVAWEALDARGNGRERLAAFLNAASVLNFDPPVEGRAAVVVAATRDGFVPTSTAQAIHHHWPGSAMDWVNAGHGSLMWRRKQRLIGGIATAFDRLDGRPDPS